MIVIIFWFHDCYHHLYEQEEITWNEYIDTHQIYFLFLNHYYVRIISSYEMKNEKNYWILIVNIEAMAHSKLTEFGFHAPEWRVT